MRRQGTQNICTPDDFKKSQKKGDININSRFNMGGKPCSEIGTD